MAAIVGFAVVPAAIRMHGLLPAAVGGAARLMHPGAAGLHVAASACLGCAGLLPAAVGAARLMHPGAAAMHVAGIARV